MSNLTMDKVRDNGLLLYEYIRGSQLYGLEVYDDDGNCLSDLDTGGVFISPIEDIIGLGDNYRREVYGDKHKHDDVWLEVNRWVHLLTKSNPSVMETLFIPEDKIITKPHPFIQNILDNRDLFLTKQIFSSLKGYAHAQISKAQGLNKKIMKPMLERKDVLDFVYTFNNRDSLNIKSWLEHYGLEQKYCGLSKVKHMYEMYALFYDWGEHIENNGLNLNDINFINLYQKSNNIENFDDAINELKNIKSKNYRGLLKDKADSVRVSLIGKDEKPLTYISFGIQAYSSHCKEYSEYKKWEKERNPIRYRDNVEVGKKYDTKNMLHTVRLLRMAHELATNQGFNIIRTNDREELLDIRHGKRTYGSLMEEADDLKKKIENAIPNCNLPNKVDRNKINELLIDLRKQQFKIKNV